MASVAPIGKLLHPHPQPQPQPHTHSHTATAKQTPRSISSPPASAAFSVSSGTSVAQGHDDSALAIAKTKQKLPSNLARNLPPKQHSHAFANAAMQNATLVSYHHNNSHQWPHAISSSALYRNTSLTLAIPPPPPLPALSNANACNVSALSPLACFDPTHCSCSWLPSLASIYKDFDIVDAISPAHALLWAAFVWWCVIIGYSLTYPPLKVCNICVAENWPPWNIWPLTLSMTVGMGLLLNVNAYSSTAYHSFRQYMRSNVQQFLRFFTIPFFVASYSSITSQRYFILFIPLNTTLLAAASASTVVVYVALRLLHAHLSKRHEESKTRTEGNTKMNAQKKALEEIAEEDTRELRLKSKVLHKNSDVLVQVARGTVNSPGETQIVDTKRAQLVDTQTQPRNIQLQAAELHTASTKNEVQVELQRSPGGDGLSHRRVQSKGIPSPLMAAAEVSASLAAAPKSMSSVSLPAASISVSASASASNSSSISRPGAAPPPSAASSQNSGALARVTTGELSRIAAMTEARLRFLTINLEPSQRRGLQSWYDDVEVDREREREKDSDEKHKQQSQCAHSPSDASASRHVSQRRQVQPPRAASPSLSDSVGRPSRSLTKAESQSCSYLKYEEDVKEFHRLHVALSTPPIQPDIASIPEAIIASTASSSVSLSGKKLLLLRLSIHDADEDISLVDQLLWDPANPNSTPEIYAANLCAELGFAGELGKKWLALISQEIRKQVCAHNAALAAGDMDGMCSILDLPQAESIFRSVGDAHHWQPQIQLPNHTNTPSMDHDLADHDHERERQDNSRSRESAPSVDRQSTSGMQSLPMKTFREDESFH